MLSELKLDTALVTDAGLAYLKGLSNLTKLSLGAAQITDPGLRI